VEGTALLAALSGIPGGATASQLAAALGGGAEGRALAVTLRKLVEQGQVLEIRPGRYQSSGTGGEFSVMLEPAATGGGIQARFPDGRVLPVNARYALGARAGDVAQAVVGEDQQALVTRILRRTGREVVGLVNFRPGGSVLIPDNRREGELPVLSTYARFPQEYQAGNRAVGTVAVDANGQAGVHLTRILGEETPEVADFRHVCLVHDLPGDFPSEVESQAKAYRENLQLGKREDLRQKLVFTIDPATAKDFDDAISLVRDDRGNRVLGVHIADVSNYVIAHTPLDAEAARRGTSIYLINRVIPMLPESLSNGLCSLVPDRDRYCLSAFLTLDRSNRLVGTRLAETMIRSRHRMTYEQVLAVLEKRDEAGKWPGDLRDTLKEVSDIAQNLRRAREQAGALNLFSVEHRFSLDVNGLPIEVERETTDISHQLIEECMLLANRAVAAWLGQHHLPCVYRVHEQPDEERLAQFARLLETYGIDASQVQNRFGLQRLLERLKQEPPAARLVLNFLCLRSFKKAIYSVDNIGHYALAFPDYAHFTSPIRRYPDLLVHRLVKRGLGLPGFTDVEIRKGYLDALAKQSSNLEQRAESAERDIQARKSARYLAARMGDTFPGVVTGANPGGLTVQLMETGMEGFVPMRELKDDYYTFVPDRLSLVGRRSGRLVTVGMELDVQVVAVDIPRNDVVLGLVGGKLPAAPVTAAPVASESPRREGGSPAAPAIHHKDKSHAKREEKERQRRERREERQKEHEQRRAERRKKRK
jgi:ribonuclease R